MSQLRRVLVVDDDVTVRLRVRDLLASIDNCEVLEAADGYAGLAEIARRPPDLILLDLNLPGLSGLEVCAHLRRDPVACEIPIIVLSSSDEDTAMPAALEAGAEDYLLKPIPALELRAKVRIILRLNRFHALSAERHRLRWLVEHSLEALVILDSAGSLVAANPRACELFDLPATPAPDGLALLGRYYRPDPADAFDRIRARGFSPGEGFALFLPETRFSASRWLQANLFSDPDNRSADLLIKFTDRTGEVHRELETWTFQNLLAHKFRTPLNGMGATLDLVLSDPGLLQSTQARKLLASARLSARRLEDSVIDVLRYHDALCAPESDATAADQDWEKLLHETASEAGLELLRINSRGAGSAPVPGYCVASLRLALVEVMENYRKFSEAPRLGLDASFLGPDRLRLFAPGPALPPEFVARLGRPYWQVEKNFSGEIPGMGLGLATARLLLRSQGADLTFSLHVDPAGLVSDFSLPLPPSL